MFPFFSRPGVSHAAKVPDQRQTQSLIKLIIMIQLPNYSASSSFGAPTLAASDLSLATKAMEQAVIPKLFTTLIATF